VANYNVDIEIGVKGAQRLTKFRKEINKTSKEVDGLNQQIRRAAGNKFENSINRLNASVSKTSKLLNRAAVGTKDFEKAARLVVRAEKERDIVLQKTEKTLARIRLQESAETLTHREKLRLIKLVGAEKVKDLKVVQETLKIEQQRQKTLAAGKGMGLGKRLSGAVGSGIIGGGFPLLFGQGPTAALGGGIGGLAGGLIGGQFGFALSIAGTTIGSALDDLSKALAKPTENIEKLVTKLGLVDTPTGKLALELEKLGLTSSAAELLIKEFEREFGLSAEQIKENAEKMTEFNNEINKLGTSLTLLLSDVLGPLIKELNNLIQGKRPEGTSRNVTGVIDFFTGNLFDLDKRGGILDELPPLPGQKRKRPLGNIPAAEGNPTIGGVKLNPNFGKPGITVNPNQGAIDLKDRAIQFKEIEPLKQALQIEKERLNLSGGKLRLMQENFALTNLDNEIKLLESERTDEVNDALELKIKKLQIARDTQAEVVRNTEALIDPLRQVSGIIAQDIGDGIKGLIRGTSTLGDTLNNVLNKMIDGFLNLGLFGNFGGTFERGSGLLGGLFKARGGPVKGGNSYIVGEKGPEMFSPGVSGTITPNHALGGSTTVIVNVDATGSNVEGDEQQGRELGRLISIAVQSELVQQKRPGGILA
tara:strand:- start:555 stop:2495 length:1941 start_codon:yes stop_codon:yes gene_type:complete